MLKQQPHLTLDPWRNELLTDEIWQLRLQPDVVPTDPYNDATFLIKARFTRASDQHSEERVATWIEPQDIIDLGDRETWRPAGPGAFVVRWRPREAGTYQCHIEIVQDGQTVWQDQLDTLQVSGASVDHIIRVDPHDHRFFVKPDGSLYWPMAINLRSIWDVRSYKRLDTEVTPGRTVAAYERYFARLSAQGIELVEIWASSWNLALEWRDEWPGYGGLGQYHQGHAAQLEQVLESAWQHGIRVLLVIRNHGSASTRVDSEWRDNPYNLRARAMNTVNDQAPSRPPRGLVREPHEFFVIPRSLPSKTNSPLPRATIQ